MGFIFCLRQVVDKRHFKAYFSVVNNYVLDK